MKKFYSFLFVFVMIPMFALGQSTTGKVYVGYAKYDDQIWEYDGIYLDHTAKVGCAVLLTKDMLAPYVGGTITGMRVGWGTSQRTGAYEGFVRRTFNGEDLTTGKAAVSYSYSSSTPGWNNMTLTKYEIPEDIDQLVVGFTTKINKNEYAIPTLYPHGTANSCWLWVEGDVDAEGNARWVDMRDLGILPIQLVIQDTKGSFNFLPVITLLTDNGIYETGKAGDVLLRVKNNGSQAIKNIEVTSKQGEQTWSKTITANVASGKTSSSFLAPLYSFQSGDVELSITKVNGTELATPITRTVKDIISVPSDVASQYKRLPLVEYYVSENNYMSPRYYDDYVEPGMAKLTSKMNFVCQHMDDQFMTGEDDATILALQLCDNDSSQVSIPALTIDRAMETYNVLFQMNSAWNPMFPVFTMESYYTQTLNDAIKQPTFVSINADGELKEDGETIEINVGGMVAGGVMPEGEKPRLTVYLMEKYVDSDSQLFWTDKEKEETMGHYTHANIIREILSDTNGDVINAEGEINASYTTTIAPEWKKEDLYIVAFVHRDSKMGGKRMHVFNSCKGNINDATGIYNIKNEELVTKNDIYDLSGRRVTKPTKGIYIVNGKKVIK